MTSYKNNNLSVYKIYIPSLWNFIIISNKITKKIFLFFYSLNYYFHLPVSNIFTNLIYQKDSAVLSIFYFFSHNFLRIFFNFFKKFFYSFSMIFFKKLKFKGKGYYIYKNKRNTIALQFGYSHIKRLFFFYTYVKFLSKTSIIIFGINRRLIDKSASEFSKIRSINIFTGKGVRFTKQIIYRKTGKVSSYR